MSISHSEVIKGIQPKLNRKQRRQIARAIRSQGKAASYARFSSDMQNESSNDDQHRRNEEDAKDNVHTIAPEHRYSDVAVSGTKLDRDGLNQLLQDAEAGKFSTIYFFSLSRLARESLMGMTLLKKLVYKFGVRVISVSEGIDTDRTGWETYANLLFMFHQKFIEQLAADVLRAQQGVVLGNQSVGDHRFGYTSTPIPGASPRGRGKKPPKEYGINPDEAKWVVAIFKWFVEKKLSLTRIVKLLNNRKVPKGHRAQIEKWTHGNVVSILESTKYVGLWPWGLLKNLRDPETGRVWQEPRDEKELSDDWMRHRPDLALVEVELFKAAQDRLKQNRDRNAEYRDKTGRFKSNKGSRGNPPRNLVSNLLICQCGHKLYIGGPNGKYLFCPNYKRGTCKRKVNIRRNLATKLIMDVVLNAICKDEAWLAETFLATKVLWEKTVNQVPSEVASLQRSLDGVDRKIAHLLDRIENGNDEISVDNRLKQRQKERQELLSRLSDLSRQQVTKADPPTKEWVKKKLLGMIDETPDSDPVLIETIHDLLGGCVLTEAVHPTKGRPYIRGKLTLRVSRVTRLLLGVPDLESEQDAGGELVVEIDFKDPDPVLAFANLSEEAKKLYDQNLMNAEIANVLNVSRSTVTKLLHHWFESRNQKMPDGRGRRATLAKKHLQKPYYQEISDRVQALLDKGMLIADVAAEVGCDINTVRSASQYWHKSRSLPYQDGRTRRKSLVKKSRTSP